MCEWLEEITHEKAQDEILGVETDIVEMTMTMRAMTMEMAMGKMRPLLGKMRPLLLPMTAIIVSKFTSLSSFKDFKWTVPIVDIESVNRFYENELCGVTSNYGPEYFPKFSVNPRGVDCSFR